MVGRLPDGTPHVSHKPTGRKTGSRNRRTIALLASMEAERKRLEELANAPFEGDAHALLVSIYKNTTLPITERADAAKAAIKFEKPALASEDRTIRGEVGLYQAIPVAERDAILLTAVAQELIEG